MKFYDPYYLLDPTKPHDWEAHQGRTSDGRFAIKSILISAGDNNFPIDSTYWKRYAVGTRNRLDAMRGEDFRFSVIPNETPFSWRMLCEVYEIARDSLLANDPDETAITKAHQYLQDKQFSTARHLLKNVLDAGIVNECEALCHWFNVNWDLIPEIEP